MLSALPSRRRTLGALLLCGAAYLYVFPYQIRINNPNENVRLYMTAALAEQGTYEISELRRRWGWVNDCAAKDGQIFSVKAPATSFLGVPPYFVYYWITEHTDLDFDRTFALWLCRVFASILPWLLFLVFFHRWLGRHTSSPLARDAAFLSVALGSCLYGYGLLFMSHTLSAAAAFGAFMLLYDARKAGRMRAGRAFLAGFLAAMVTLLEYPGFLASALLSLYALFVVRPWIRLLPYALGGMIPTAAMMHFQYRCFGSPFTPGHLYVENDFLRGRHEEGFFGAVGVQPEALFGLLVHPGAGLFPLTPILLFGVVGLGILAWRRGSRAEALVVGAISGLTLLAISAMNNWRGGWTLGPRYLVLLYPFLAWTALFGLEPIVRRAPRTAAALALGTTAVGLVMSGIPSVYYPHFPPEIVQPVSEVVAVLVEHDFAPYAAGNLLGVYGNASMLPMLALGLGALLWLAWAAVRRDERASALVGGVLLAGLLVYPLLREWAPRVPEVDSAVGLITRIWTPAGHDEPARLMISLRDHPSADGYRELAGLYDVEGRDREARAMRARAHALERREARP